MAQSIRDPFLSNLGAQQEFFRKHPDMTSIQLPNTSTFTVEDIERANSMIIPPINVPSLNIGTPQPLVPSTPMTFDPLLSPASILSQGQDALALAKAPVDPTKFIVPGAQALLTKGIQEQANVARASAQSDFAARGMTGSSTEVQTLTRDIPAATNLAIQEGTIKLLQSAYPLALQDKQTIIDATLKTASLSTQLRSMIGDEQFKQLSLDQQREIANQDVQLKLTLADIEIKFQAALKQAEFQFTAAENEMDRALAREQFEFYKQQKAKAQEGAFLTSLTTLVGAGIGGFLGFKYGGPGGAAAGASAGASIGKEAGSVFTPRADDTAPPVFKR